MSMILGDSIAVNYAEKRSSKYYQDHKDELLRKRTIFNEHGQAMSCMWKAGENRFQCTDMKKSKRHICAVRKIVDKRWMPAIEFLDANQENGREFSI